MGKNTASNKNREGRIAWCERSRPTRARAVLTYIGWEFDGPPSDTTTNFPTPRKLAPVSHRLHKDHRGSPKRRSRSEKRAAWFNPDEQEKQVRELNRVQREELKKAPPEDGLIAGPLKVAATVITPSLQEKYDLIGEGHSIALQMYMVGLWGELVHSFDPDNSPFGDFPSYNAWREIGKTKAKENC